jgi:hypothetical protein
VSLDPASLITSLIVSGVGWVLFSYGRSQRRVPHALMGMLIMVYPYFISSVGWQFGVLAILCGVLWLLTRLGL